MVASSAGEEFGLGPSVTLSSTKHGAHHGLDKVTITDMKQATAGPPIDYSFKDLKDLLDLVHEEPVSGRPRHPAIPSDRNASEYLDTLQEEELIASPSGKRRDTKYNSNALRVCNNQIMTLVGLERVLPHVLDDPSQLVWLDASCNKLATVEDIILKYPNLQVLYLHGNSISNLHDVLKLQQLPKLQKLTLHGNPIAEQKNYKVWVSAHLPLLRNLDFSAITRLERDKVNTWYQGYKKQLDARHA